MKRGKSCWWPLALSAALVAVHLWGVSSTPLLRPSRSLLQSTPQASPTGSTPTATPSMCLVAPNCSGHGSVSGCACTCDYGWTSCAGGWFGCQSDGSDGVYCNIQVSNTDQARTQPNDSTANHQVTQTCVGNGTTQSCTWTAAPGPSGHPLNWKWWGPVVGGGGGSSVVLALLLFCCRHRLPRRLCCCCCCPGKAPAAKEAEPATPDESKQAERTMGAPRPARMERTKRPPQNLDETTMYETARGDGRTMMQWRTVEDDEESRPFGYVPHQAMRNQRAEDAYDGFSVDIARVARAMAAVVGYSPSAPQRQTRPRLDHTRSGFNMRTLSAYVAETASEDDDDDDTEEDRSRHVSRGRRWEEE